MGTRAERSDGMEGPSLRSAPTFFRLAVAALSMPLRRPRDEVRTYRMLAKRVRRPFRVLLHRRLSGPPFLAEVELTDGRRIAYRVPTADRHVVWSVLLADEYRLDSWAPGPLGVVVDVGAHVGAFTMRVAPRARRVLALEPEPTNAALLRRNVERAGHGHVTVLACAAGARTGPGRLEVSSSETSGHHLVEGAPPATRATLPVDVVRLPELLDASGVASVDLLKIDVEGREGSVLESLEGWGWARVARVVLEYHPGVVGPRGWESGDAIAARLRERGFRVEAAPERRRPGQGLLFASRPVPPAGHV